MFGLKNNFLFKFSKDRNLKVFRRKDHSEAQEFVPALVILCKVQIKIHCHGFFKVKSFALLSWCHTQHSAACKQDPTQ